MSIEFFILIIFIAVFILILWFFRRTGKRLGILLDALGFKKRKFLLSQRIKESYQGEPVLLEFLSNNQLELSFPLKTSGGFTIKRKQDMGLFEDHFGLVRTGQADFDEKFGILSNREAEMVEFFQNPEIRELVEGMFNEWIYAVELGGKDLKATIRMNANVDPALLKKIPENLFKLKKFLKEKEIVQKEIVKGSSYLPLYFLYAIPPVLSITEFSLAILLFFESKNDFAPANWWSLILRTLLIFVPVALAYLYLTFRITRQYPAAFQKFSICAFLIFIWFGFTTLFIQAVNGYFDKSLAKKVEYVVVDKIPGRDRLLLEDQERAAKSRKAGFIRKYFRRSLDYYAIRLSVRNEEYLKAKPYLTMATIFLRDGFFGVKWIEAYVFYETSTKSSFARDCHNQAYVLYKGGHLDEAIDEYTKCIEANGDDALLYYNRGVAYREKGLYQNALSDFEKAVSLKPEMLEAHKNIDWIIFRKKEWEKAIAHWNKYIDAKPEDAEGYFERARAFYHKKDIENTRKDLKKACELGKKEACKLLRKKRSAH